MKDDVAAEIERGLGLINASGLASGTSVLQAVEHGVFENYCKAVHHEFGRWFCWHAFCVGTETILRAAYQKRNLTAPAFGGDHSWSKLGIPADEISKTTASIKQLATRRNEGAHEYKPNKRDGYFSEVNNDYVPAINLLLKSLLHNTESGADQETSSSAIPATNE